jgi:AraC-like DNA-binding protein
MLRYLAAGPRNFVTEPVPPTEERLNWEFYCVAEGQAAPYFTSGKNPPLRCTSLWLLPPRLRYGWRGDEKGCYRICFHFTQIPEELSLALGDLPYLVEEMEPRKICHIIELARELEPHWKRPHSFSHLSYDKTLLDLAIMILDKQPKRRDVPLEMLPAERVERAIAWFNFNMFRNPTVDEVASALHMTGTHLRRTFKAIRKKTPHEIFREMQVKRACGLLASTQLTQEEIARQCGFKSVTDFSRVFRCVIGTPADKWRKEVTATISEDSSRVAARDVRIG